MSAADARSRFRRDHACDKWRLRYDFAEDFVLMRWQTSTRVDGHYVLVRLLYYLAHAIIVHLLARHAADSHLRTMHIYFTHWTFSSMCVYGLVSLVDVVAAYTMQQVDLYGSAAEIDVQATPRLRIFECRPLNYCLLILTNLVHNFGACVTIIFWSMGSTQDVTDLTWSTQMYHSWLGMLIITNYLLISVPIRFTFVYVPVTVGCCYISFMVIFYFGDGEDFRGRRYIYKAMDWRARPGTAAFYCAFSLTLAVVVQFVLYWIERLKLWIYYKYFVMNSDLTIEHLRGFYADG